MPLFPGPLQCGGGRRPGSLADACEACSTSKDFSPRTVLTKNICTCVQHIMQHFPTTMPFLTASTITLSWMASTAPQADYWPFLTASTITLSWMASTAPQADYWSRTRGARCLRTTLQSGPRHLSPRSRVCAQEWHRKDIHSHIHSHTPMHTPKIRQKNKTQQQQNTQLTKHAAFVYCSSSCPVCWWATFRKLGTCSTSEALSPRTVRTENICESVEEIHQDSPAQTKSSTHQT